MCGGDDRIYQKCGESKKNGATHLFSGVPTNFAPRAPCAGNTVKRRPAAHNKPMLSSIIKLLALKRSAWVGARPAAARPLWQKDIKTAHEAFI